MTSFVLEYAGNVAMHASNNNDDDNNNNNNNNHDQAGRNAGSDSNNNMDIASDRSSNSESDNDEGHPLLDFVVAADVFMYLGNLTVD